MRMLIFMPLLFICFTVKSQSVDDKALIRLIMDKVNTYQLKHPWREGADYNWIRGTYYTGVMAAFQATGEEKYFKQCEKWGNDFDWGIPQANTDPGASGANVLTCAQTWIESYLIKKDKKKIKHVTAHFEDARVKNPLTHPCDWYYEEGDRYVDALYVAAPVLTMLYKITGEERYSSWLDAFFWDIYGNLYDRNANLFYRDIRYTPNYNGPVTPALQLPDSILLKDARSSYIYQKTEAGKNVLWSRGNGWAFAALARILKYLPKEHGNRNRYESVFRDMAHSIKERQQRNGYWYPNLADSADFPYKETSGTGFFVYALAWGINNGILQKDEYRPVVEKGWKALYQSVSDEGRVQWGQLVGGSPYVIKQEDSHEYVTGMFLLAASEVYKLKP